MQHVLKDKRVLAFAQKHAAEEEGDEISMDEWDLENAYVSTCICKLHMHVIIFLFFMMYEPSTKVTA